MIVHGKERNKEKNVEPQQTRKYDANEKHKQRGTDPMSQTDAQQQKNVQK